MTASDLAPNTPMRRLSVEPAIDAISIVTISGRIGMRMALIHNVPTGSMNPGIGVDRSTIPATKPATRATATCSVGCERRFTGRALDTQ